MNIKELSAMISTAESLGHKDVDLYIDDSKDDKTVYSRATARLIKSGTQMDPQVILLVSYLNE